MKMWIVKLFLWFNKTIHSFIVKRPAFNYNVKDIYHVNVLQANIFVFIAEDVLCVTPVNSIDQKSDDC